MFSVDRYFFSRPKSDKNHIFDIFIKFTPFCAVIFLMVHDIYKCISIWKIPFHSKLFPSYIHVKIVRFRNVQEHF